MQSTLLVTVQGIRRKLDVELPGDVPVSDLLPLLLQMCDASTHPTGQWTINIASTGQALQAKRTLFENRVLDGEVLLLRKAKPSSTRVAASRQEKQQATPVVSKQSGSIGITWEKPSLPWRKG